MTDFINTERVRNDLAAIEAQYNAAEGSTPTVHDTQDAPHHERCRSRFPANQGMPCTCGRDEALRPFGGGRD